MSTGTELSTADDLAHARQLLADESDAGLARLAEHQRGLGPDGRRDPALVARRRAAWRKLLEDRTLAPTASRAVERAGVLDQAVDPRVRVLVEDLVSLLGSASGEVAFDLLARLWLTAVEKEVRVRAGLALLALGHAPARDLVAMRLDRAEGLELTLAIQGVFARDPAAAYDTLAPRFATPSQDAGRWLDMIVDVLMRDVVDDGKQHWGSTRGWFTADPRWRKLCEQWRRLPEPGTRARWGNATAQRICECATWLCKNVTSAS